MTTASSLRGVVLFLILACVLLGVATRFRHRATASLFESSEGNIEGLRAGDRIGDATIERIIETPLPGFRLRLRGCSGPMSVLAIPLVSAAPQVMDQIFGRPPFRSVDIYRAHIRDDLTHFAKWAAYFSARVHALWSNTETEHNEWFVRAYSPANCAIPEDVYLAWADAALKLRF